MNSRWQMRVAAMMAASALGFPCHVSADTSVSAPGFETLTFGTDTYKQVETHHTLTERSATYRHPTESTEHWTESLVVHWLPSYPDPADYAEAVQQSVLTYFPEAHPVVMAAPHVGLFEFEIGTSSVSATPAEFHMGRAEMIPGALRVVELIERNDGTDTTSPHFNHLIRRRHSDWATALAELRIPESPIDNATNALWSMAVAAIRWYIHSPHVFVEKKLIEAPFTLAHRPQPPQHAWLYIRSSSVLTPVLLPFFLDAVRAYRATGLDLKKQPSVTDSTLAQILTPNADWPIEPGWRSLIDGLRYLNLKGTPVTDAAAATLAKMTPLQVLILNDNITDDGLRTITAGLTNLVKFRPGGPRITDRGLESLSGLTKLHRLDLTDTSVTGRGVQALKNLSLIEVDFGAMMGDDALLPLSAIPTLVHMEMTKSRVTSVGISQLKRFTHLHTLFIGSVLDDSGIQTLIQIPTLRRLDMTGARITDSGVKTLAALTNLEELALSQTNVTDQGLAALTSMKRLRFLEVSDTHVSAAGLAQLTSLPALDVISFSHTGPLKLRDLKPLGALPYLRTIIINGAPLDHAALDYLKRSSLPTSPHAWHWIASAWADAAPLSDDTDVSQVSAPASPIALSATGLHRIHDVEADLDEIIPDVSNPAAEEQDTAQNFLGEITVNATKAAPAKK